jgi:hypothetical protein
MTITNVDIANKISNLVDKWQLREDQMINWLSGTATGGTNSDGKYPLTDVLGVTTLVECPAVLANLSGAGAGSVTAAATSATASATSATASATSATASATSAAASNAAKVAAELARDQAQNYAGNAAASAASALDPALFSSTTKGAVAASGGGTVNFLRADGTWATPAGGGGSSAWGSITGTLSSQTDLQTALNSKAGTATATTGASGLMSSADKTKLDGVATSATANSSDVTLLARANHTGTQLAATISDFGTAAVSAVDADLATNGVPLTTGVIGTVPSNELRMYSTVTGEALKSLPKFKDSLGLTDYMMFDLTSHNFALWTGHVTLGCSVGGTATTLGLLTTNTWTRKRRQSFRNVVTTTNQSLGVFTSNPVVLGTEPWYFKTAFSTALYPSGSRLFVGVTTGNIVVTDAPTTSQGIGIATKTTDANTTINLFTSDGTTITYTPITVPAIAAGNAYLFEMLSPGDGTVKYRLENFLTGAVILEGTATTGLATASASCSGYAQMSNGTANTAVNTVSLEVNTLLLRSLN